MKILGSPMINLDSLMKSFGSPMKSFGSPMKSLGSRMKEGLLIYSQTQETFDILETLGTRLIYLHSDTSSNFLMKMMLKYY